MSGRSTYIFRISIIIIIIINIQYTNAALCAAGTISPHEHDGKHLCCAAKCGAICGSSSSLDTVCRMHSHVSSVCCPSQIIRMGRECTQELDVGCVMSRSGAKIAKNHSGCSTEKDTGCLAAAQEGLSIMHAVPSEQHDCFDIFKEIWSPSEIGPSEEGCSRAVREGLYRATTYQELGKKLRSGRCLKIAVIGSSITYGNGVLGRSSTCAKTAGLYSGLPPACAALCKPGNESQSNFEWDKLRCSDTVASKEKCGNTCHGATTWHAAVKHALDLTAPCAGEGGHTIHHHPVSGAGTLFWVSELQTKAKFPNLLQTLKDADVIFVETAVNDPPEGKPEKATEMLLLQLESVAPQAAKVWVTVGWRSGDEGNTAEDGIWRVLEHYGLQQISLRQGLLRPPSKLFPRGFTRKYIIPNGPMGGLISDYRINCCHVSRKRSCEAEYSYLFSNRFCILCTSTKYTTQRFESLETSAIS